MCKIKYSKFDILQNRLLKKLTALESKNIIFKEAYFYFLLNQNCCL
jgi:hypothetical protein